MRSVSHQLATLYTNSYAKPISAIICFHSFLPFFIHSLLTTHTHTLKPAEWWARVPWYLIRELSMMASPILTRIQMLVLFGIAVSSISVLEIDLIWYLNPNICLFCAPDLYAMQWWYFWPLTINGRHTTEQIFYPRALNSTQSSSNKQTRERKKTPIDNYKTNSQQMESKVFILSYRNTYLKQNK